MKMYLAKEDKGDISNYPAVKHGMEHEKDAADKYNSIYPDKITECGIFVSKKRPYLAASPDRLDVLNKMVIEIKCPYK